jgi:phosphoribosyl 1,2-cyclic phosphodiesterase
MEISVIASGSNGNSCLVEHNNTSVLIDAGKSAREIEKRLNNLGKSLENVDGLVVSHAHIDHIRGAGVIYRRYGIPVYMTKQTYSYFDCQAKLFTLNSLFHIKNIRILPIHTSHDVHSCGFVIGNFGIFTDTGKVTRQISDALPNLKAVLLESNHDIDMLISGPYPPYLKSRILSDTGHLSNIHASQLVAEKGKSLSRVFLGHLSAVNNTPELARKTFESLAPARIDCVVCSRDSETGTFQF